MCVGTLELRPPRFIVELSLELRVWANIQIGGRGKGEKYEIKGVRQKTHSYARASR